MSKQKITKIFDIETIEQLEGRIKIVNGQRVLSLGNRGNAFSFPDFLKDEGDEKKSVYVKYSARHGTHTVKKFLNI